MKKDMMFALGIFIFVWTFSGCGNSGRNSGNSINPAEAMKAAPDEMAYDDGLPEAQHSPWWDKPGGQLAVVFTPATYPAVLTKVRFLVGIDGVPTTEFRVRVFGGSVSEGPDESRDLLASEVRTSAPFGNKWVEVDLSDRNIMITSGDFCVSMEWLTPAGDHGAKAQLLGADYSKPDRRSWWKTDSISPWVRIEDVANVGDRDLMIRATIAGK